MAVAQAGDQAVELGLAGHVDALHRFVEHQQFRLAQQARASKTRCISPPETLCTGLSITCSAPTSLSAARRRAVHAGHQAQEAQHRQWQRRIDVQLLRHVADAQLGLAPDAAAVRLEQTEHGAHQVVLPAPLGPIRVTICPGSTLSRCYPARFARQT
jgi:hypothetical protein